MLNISGNPYLRLKEKLKGSTDNEEGVEEDLFKIKNEVFIAYCEEIPLKERVKTIDDQIHSEKIRADLKRYLRKIVEKGEDYYDRRRRKKDRSRRG